MNMKDDKVVNKERELKSKRKDAFDFGLDQKDWLAMIFCIWSILLLFWSKQID